MNMKYTCRILRNSIYLKHFQNLLYVFKTLKGATIPKVIEVFWDGLFLLDTVQNGNFVPLRQKIGFSLVISVGQAKDITTVQSGKRQVQVEFKIFHFLSINSVRTNGPTQNLRGIKFSLWDKFCTATGWESLSEVLVGLKQVITQTNAIKIA